MGKLRNANEITGGKTEEKRQLGRCGDELLGSTKCRKFLYQLSDYQLLKIETTS
jgi:hypothetical protein